MQFYLLLDLPRNGSRITILRGIHPQFRVITLSRKFVLKISLEAKFESVFSLDTRSKKLN